MTAIDLTLALTIHSETTVAGPTIQSAEAAIRAVEANGFHVERLLGFDNPTPEAVAFFSSQKYSKWKIFNYAFRDQGQTRNALSIAATGKWLAFLDGDDLFSENWLIKSVHILNSATNIGRKIIVHPEVNWVFDSGSFVFTKICQNDKLFSPYYFLVTNYYDALCVASRDVWMECLYPHRDIPSGFAYEDWQWNIESMSKGWFHTIANDTIIFKRRRDSSQTHESRNRTACIRALDVMTINKLNQLIQT